MRLLHDGVILGEMAFDPESVCETLLVEVPWLVATSARYECFMADREISYTYGSGEGVRTYTTVPCHTIVSQVLDAMNSRMGLKGVDFNGCFLNRYDDASQHLGWHADDSPGQDTSHPIAVVSFGQEREIWFRRNGQSGVTPERQRVLLTQGSVLLMPPGFQETHQHRIPKGDRPMGPRVSLTLRRFL